MRARRIWVNRNDWPHIRRYIGRLVHRNVLMIYRAIFREAWILGYIVSARGLNRSPSFFHQPNTQGSSI